MYSRSPIQSGSWREDPGLLNPSFIIKMWDFFVVVCFLTCHMFLKYFEHFFIQLDPEVKGHRCKPRAQECYITYRIASAYGEGTC